MNRGRLSLKVVLEADGITYRIDKEPGSDAFGASVWRPTAQPKDDLSLPQVFDRVKKNQNVDGYFSAPDHSLGDNLQPYKDHAVLFGRFLGAARLNYPSTDSGIGREYSDFICLYDNDSPPDGDLNFDIQVDRVSLESDRRFWTTGWEAQGPPLASKAKLDYAPGVLATPSNYLHVEATMFGRTAECGANSYEVDPLLPGWQERDGNSVLVNGRPLNGSIDVVGPSYLDEHNRPAGADVRSIRGKELRFGAPVRVIGALVLDCGHGDTEEALEGGDEGDIGWLRPCYSDEGDVQNQEMHPLYSIDLIDPTARADLTGVWATKWA